jgi:hypothetical protein
MLLLLLLQVEARYALAVGRESSDKLAEALANKAEVRDACLHCCMPGHLHLAHCVLAAGS